MPKNLTLFLLVLVLGTQPVFAQNYNKIMGKAIKKSIGSDLKGYQTFSYPTDNFGLLTSYEQSTKSQNFICDMFDCIGIDSVNSTSANWLSMNNFAAVGSGGSIDLSEKDQRKVAVNLMLPEIFSVIGLTAKGSYADSTQITITIGQAHIRQLRKQPVLDYLNKLDNSSLLKQAFLKGTLVLIVSDCVIDNLSVTIQVSRQDSTSLDAKIGSTTGSAVVSKVFNGASLSVAVTKNSSGTFTFKVLHPVIYARLAKTQPAAGSLQADDSFAYWTVVDPDKKIHPAKK